MARPRVSAGGGFAAIGYVLKKGFEAGSPLELYRRLRSRNVCKTCALGMGGQRGGMVNEAGHFPEVCKKSVQAQAGDMAGVISEETITGTPIDELAKLTPAECERLGRLAFPVIARPGDDRFSRLDWEAAYDLVAEALRGSSPEETFFYASGRASNEAAFLFQLVARAYGTANIHNCSYYCHNASGVGLSRVYGSGTASVVLEDLAEADLAVVIGANPASNHPRLITQLIELRRRGGKVIVINPLRELGLERFRLPSDVKSLFLGSKVSDLYMQPRIGGDVGLLKALLKGLIERHATVDEFIAAHTSGWEEVRADLEASDWLELVEHCGVEHAEIDRAVDILAGSEKGILCWAMGLTHHRHGVDNVLALANLALARGWLGKNGSGLLPIRGHSNVQGVGSVGVSPGVKKAFAAKLEELYGITIPPGGGQHTYASMVAADEGRVRTAVILGGNLWGSNPDLDWARRALGKIDLTFSATTKLNPGHFHGRGKTAIIVPVLARDEEGQSTTQESMFNFVRLSEGGRPAVRGDLRSEVEIIASIAERILPGGRFDWQALRSHEELRQQIAAVVPGYAASDRIGKGGDEFQIEGRTFHEPEFATDDGRARFHVTPLPDFRPAAGEFRLMTVRSEGQFNTVVYEEEDLYRGNRRRDVVMISSDDALELGIDEGDRVEVASEVSAMEVSAAIVDIRPGNLAMYYPEANILVPRRIDPASKTPAFKSISVKLTPARTTA